MKSPKLENENANYLTNYMKKVFLSLHLIILFLILTLFEQVSHSAAGQLLNDNFFQNPAELSLINRIQLMGGMYL